MEEDIKELIISLRKSIVKVNEILSDCPDKAEAKLLNKSLKKMNDAMELLNRAKNYKNDLLYARQNIKSFGQ